MHNQEILMIELSKIKILIHNNNKEFQIKHKLIK